MSFGTFGGRRLIALVAAAAALAGAVATAAVSASGAGATPGGHGRDRDWHGRGEHGYTIGLFGDMPYGALGRSQYPNLLADINRSHVAFSIFDGDLQAG